MEKTKCFWSLTWMYTKLCDMLAITLMTLYCIVWLSKTNKWYTIIRPPWRSWQLRKMTLRRWQAELKLRGTLQGRREDTNDRSKMLVETDKNITVNPEVVEITERVIQEGSSPQEDNHGWGNDLYKTTGGGQASRQCEEAPAEKGAKYKRRRGKLSN